MSQLDFNTCLRNLISFAQKVIPPKHYGINQPLTEYTRAILNKISTKKTSSSNSTVGNKYTNITMDDIKYGFMTLYLKYSQDIQKANLTWIINPDEPVFVHIRNTNSCAYPLTQIYTTCNDEDKRLLSATLLSAFSHSLGNKQVEQKDNITKNLTEMFPELTTMVGKEGIDVNSILSDVNFIMNTLEKVQVPDYKDREDIITAIIESLQPLEKDIEVNAAIKRVLSLGENKGLVDKLPRMVTKMLPSILNSVTNGGKK